jgi:hypothetical protein
MRAVDTDVRWVAALPDKFAIRPRSAKSDNSYEMRYNVFALLNVS